MREQYDRLLNDVSHLATTLRETAAAQLQRHASLQAEHEQLTRMVQALVGGSLRWALDMIPGPILDFMGMRIAVPTLHEVLLDGPAVMPRASAPCGMAAWQERRSVSWVTWGQSICRG